MLPALRGAIGQMAFGSVGQDRVHVFGEVPAVAGIPDLVAVRFDEEAIRARKAAGVLPLATESEVRIAQEAATPCTASELAQRVGLSADYLRRVVLPGLQDSGWLERDGPYFQRTRTALDVGQRVVTVEAKLRDWRRAFSQAKRQGRSADAAYIAVPAATARLMGADLEAIASRGIGVISVGPPAQKPRVLIRPVRIPSATTRVGRMLLAERALALHLQGHTEGQVSPVFGWVLPEDFRP